MKKLARLLASLCFACAAPAFADEFKNVKCGSDIAKALIGQRSSNERVVVTEGKYRSLGLKPWQTESWMTSHDPDLGEGGRCVWPGPRSARQRDRLVG